MLLEWSIAQAKFPRKEFTASLLRIAHRGYPGGKRVNCFTEGCAKLEQKLLRGISRSMSQKRAGLPPNGEVLQANARDAGLSVNGRAERGNSDVLWFGDGQAGDQGVGVVGEADAVDAVGGLQLSGRYQVSFVVAGNYGAVDRALAAAAFDGKSDLLRDGLAYVIVTRKIARYALEENARLPISGTYRAPYAAMRGLECLPRERQSERYCETADSASPSCLGPGASISILPR